MSEKPQPVTEIVIQMYDLGGRQIVIHAFLASHDRAIQFEDEAREYGLLVLRPGDVEVTNTVFGEIETSRISRCYRLEVNPCFDGKQVAIYLGRDGVVYDNTNLIHVSALSE